MMKLAVIESESEENNRWSMIVTFLVDNNQQNEEKEKIFTFSFFLPSSLSFSVSQLAFILLLSPCRSFIASDTRRSLSSNPADLFRANQTTANVTNMQHIYENNSLSHHESGRLIALKCHSRLIR
jgi:hypothetical protein